MFASILKGLNRGMEMLAGLSMAVLVLTVSWQVFTRYVMDSPSPWTEELSTFLMIWVSLMGASIALRHGAHLGIDYFVLKLPAIAQTCIHLVAFLSIALFSFSVLFLGGVELVKLTLMREQLSPALELPMGYVYLALPISGAFLFMHSMHFFAVAMIKLIRKDIPRG